MSNESFIFGSFDGMMSFVGIAAAGLVLHNAHVLIMSACGAAVSEGIAMAGGSFLSDGAMKGKMRRASIIGAATFLGVVIPALPFFFGFTTLSMAVSLALIAFICILIAQLKSKQYGPVIAYTQTFGVVFVAGLICLVMAFYLNGVSN